LFWFGGLKVTLELLHFDLGVVQDGMVGGLAAPKTKPFLQLGIPADVQMFHRRGRAAARQIKTAFPVEMFASSISAASLDNFASLRTSTAYRSTATTPESIMR
jgi:hypothetical protein